MAERSQWSDQMIVIGIDLGTQGARALAVDLSGQVLASGAQSFGRSALAAVAPGWFEQSPCSWREAVFGALHEAVAALGPASRHVRAISACGTSGTLCLVDAQGRSVRDAIMYSDARASDEAAACADVWQPWVDKVGFAISTSFALPRLLWVQRHEPHLYAQARWALSPADLVLAWLTGRWGISDWCNMLKSGYDTVSCVWPQQVFAALQVDERLLPAVQAPGANIGRLLPAVAADLGLPQEVVAVSGATDGTASQLASGAAAPGAWNTTIGTTLVVKGVSQELVVDPAGRVYCHRHPDGHHWLPGGASSTGGDCLSQRFGAKDLSALDATALAHSPTPLTVYPLVRRGERFPFVRPDAEGFVLGAADSLAEHYAAHLEGIACVERLAYETLAELGAPVGDTIYTAGGGVRGAALSQLRADITGRTLCVAAVPEAAMGAAILAAAAITGHGVGETVAAMVHIDHTVAPRPHMRERYDQLYARFRSACAERGYLS